MKRFFHARLNDQLFGGIMTNKEFTQFCKLAKDKPVKYMWGDYGRPISTATITAKAKQYPDHYTTAYQNELSSKIALHGIGCDCTGLIKWFLWTKGDIEKAPKYDAATDNSASGWYNAAKVRGDINTIPLDRVGLIVSMSGHCGVYVGNGEVIECTKGDFGNGVVKTKISDRKWEKWCECKWIDYIDESAENLMPVTYKMAKVTQDCPVYSTLNFKQAIGTVYFEDDVKLIGYIGRAALVIYPTSATEKVGFIQEIFIKKVV